MVRRLVEQHHVGLGQQQPRQQQPIVLPAAELLDRLSKVVAREAQSFQHALDAMIDVVGVAMRQLVLQAVVAVGQPLVFGRFVGRGQLVCRPLGIARQR